MANWERCDKCGRPMPYGIGVYPNICSACAWEELACKDVEAFIAKNKKLMEALK